MPKLRIQIIGKVQGVFFRQSAKQQAKTMNIGGWIKNLPDGNVLCEVSGNRNELLNFLDWCKQGPPRAQVQQTNIEWLDDDNLVIEDFQITG